MLQTQSFFSWINKKTKICLLAKALSRLKNYTEFVYKPLAFNPMAKLNIVARVIFLLRFISRKLPTTIFH